MANDLTLRKDFTRKLPVSVKGQVRLELIGMEAICEWVIDGDRVMDIAKRLGLSSHDVSAWCLNHEDANLYRAAQEASAECLMDKGSELMERAAENPDITNAMVTLTKARADYLKSWAGMRSRRHRERQPMEDTGMGATFAPTFVIHAVPADDGKVIECE